MKLLDPVSIESKSTNLQYACILTKSSHLKRNGITVSHMTVQRYLQTTIRG